MLLRPLTDFIELCLAHRIRVDDMDNFSRKDKRPNIRPAVW
jgi:hypothetical protein